MPTPIPFNSPQSKDDFISSDATTTLQYKNNDLVTADRTTSPLLIQQQPSIADTTTTLITMTTNPTKTIIATIHDDDF
jgi:hypothetical protein